MCEQRTYGSVGAGRATAPATRSPAAAAPRGGPPSGPEPGDGGRRRGSRETASDAERPGGERIPDEVIDELLAGARTEEEIVGPGGLLAQLTKRLVERAMEVELTDHLGYEPHQEPPGGAGNTRNGSTPEDAGDRARAGADRHAAGSRRELRAEDRPQAPAALRGVRRQDPRALLPRALDAGHRGAPGRDLRRQGRPRPDRRRSPTRSWTTPARGQRPLEDVYPVVFLDALVLKIREGGSVQRRACYLALASRSTATATCSACGSRRPRARSSGCRSSPSSSSAASRTS